MLTNLDWLATGEQFPPKDQDTQNRLQLYEQNKDLFHGEHGNINGIFKESMQRLKRVIGNYDDVLSIATLLNYNRLVSKKTADLMFGEHPFINLKDDKETIEQIEDNTLLYNKFYENVIDVSRYGNGVFYIYDDEGKGNFETIDPMTWFPIYDAMNKKKIAYHVIAYVVDGSNNRKYLNVQIHDKGQFIQRLYEMDAKPVGSLGQILTSLNSDLMIRNNVESNTIGKLLEEQVVKTGLSDFAIQVTTNLQSSDMCTGIDDYSDINSLICELMIRVSQISKILDKHSSPSVNAPSSAAHQDPETGEWILTMGDVFFRNSNDDPKMEYITWDAQLDANFKQIEVLLNQLNVMSEMGSTLLGGEDKGGSNTSGRALKFKMISPLAKIRRLTMLMEPVLKNVVKLLAELGGENIKQIGDEKITIKWQDGLPNDEMEEAEIIEKRRNSGTMSIKNALMQYDNMSEEKAEEEIDEIQDEESQMNPLSEKPFSGNNMIEEIEIDEGEDNE